LYHKSTFWVKYDMKKSEVVIREFASQGKKIVTKEELKELCGRYSFNFTKTKKLLLNKKFFIPILRGIYYVKDYNEKKTGTTGLSTYALISRAMELKGIKKWYFGLYSALKFLGKTHEIFNVNYVINDRFNRIKIMTITGSRFIFIKLKPSLFFGFKKAKIADKIYLRYSDLEKTMLDFIYLQKKRGKGDSIAIETLKEYLDDLDWKKLSRYVKSYPNSIKKIIKSEFYAS